MKILVVGATGTLGKAVADALAADADHEVVRASRHGPQQVDLEDVRTIEALYERIGPVDAVVCAAGKAPFGTVEGLSDADFQVALRSKLMGQVNLVRRGLAHVRDKGSFTLTSGVLARDPVPGVSALSLAGGALEAFARAAALDLPRGLRINVVSPGWVRETLERLGRDPARGTPAVDVAKIYVESVTGEQSGSILRAE